MTDLLCSGPGPHLEPPGRPDGWVAAVPTGVAVQLGPVLCPACQDRARPPDAAKAYDALLSRLEGDVDVNAQLAQQNDAIIGAARDLEGDSSISDYAATTPRNNPVAGITAPALSRVVLDLLDAIKLLDKRTGQLAAGVRIMAQHDQQDIPQRNDLITVCRYIAGHLTPPPPPETP